MSIQPVKISSSLDRSDLEAFLPDLRTIKAFEKLTLAVTTMIPSAINEQGATLNAMSEDAQGIADLARAARAAADRVWSALCAMEDRLATQRTERAAIRRLEQRLIDLETLLLDRRH